MCSGTVLVSMVVFVLLKGCDTVIKSTRSPCVFPEMYCLEKRFHPLNLMAIQPITARGQDGGPEFVTVHVSHIKYHKFTRELYASFHNSTPPVFMSKLFLVIYVFGLKV